MSTDDASSLNPAVADLDSLVAPEDAVAAPEGETKELAAFTISVKTLHGGSVSLQVSPLDTVQDVRQYLFETPEASDLTSYTLLLEGKPINDYAELSELPHLRPDSSLVMAPAAYNKRTSLLHIRRLREILSFHLVNFANTPSPSLFSHYCPADEEEETPREPAAAAAADQGTAAKGSKPAGGKKKKNGGAQKPKAGGNESGNSSKAAAAAATAKGKRSEDLVDLKSPMSLQSFYPSVSASEPQCVKSIEFAGWNPPPGNRALLGDLYYLQVTTLEGATIFITSWTHGFYVNCCTETSFNPKPAPKSCSSHSLSGVLSQVSPQFKKNFQHVLKSGQFGRHPFELMPVPIPLTPWVGLDTPHVNDKNRAEYAVLYTEMDFAGNMRDWNEEYQACKELPSGTVQERIIRDRAVLKVHNDFVDAATRGAMAIANQAVPPINPHEEPRMHLFVYNNIFFSFCYDHRDPDFKPLQPPTPTTKDAAIKDEDKDKYAEQATYVSANNDLKGIRLYNDADVSGLGTVLTAVVDYRGYRLLAQSLIPGVLQREETNLAYGSMDNGKTVHADPQFHELMRKAALHMHLKEHELTDGSGNTAQLACPINAKGIVGTDGRRYLIDLGRATPLDTNWSDAPVDTQQSEESAGQGLVLHPSSEPLLRPELVSVFCDALELRLQHQGGDNPNLTIVLKEEAAAAEGESAKATTIDLSSAVKVIHDEPATAGPEKLEEAEQPSAAATKETKEEEEEVETEAKGQAEAEVAAAGEKKDGKRYVITINPNVLHAHAHFTLTAPKEETEKDEALVKTLSAFLKDSILPRMAEEFVHLLSTPVDGQTLASIMHRNGINLRYLGRLAHLCKGRPFLVRLCEQEMIVRAAKYEFNRYLRETEDHLLSFAISHFLNCLFGDAKALPEGVDLHTFEDDATPDSASGHSNGTATTTGGGGGGGKKNRKNKGKGGETTHRSLATLPKAKIFSLTSQQLWQTLQQLVQKRFGYDISLKGGAVIPRNPAGVDEATLNTRQRLRSLAGVRSFCQKVGIQVVARNYELSYNEPFKRRDILDVFPLVKHLNPKSKDGQQLLDAGKVFLGQGRLDVAFELFNEALAIFHQVYGPLHPDTALCYGNLAMVHYHANDTAQALVHQKKMVIINERVHGLDHHDTAHSYGNLALFTRDLKKDTLIPAALRCLQRAHYLASLVCGPHHPDSPNTLMHMGTMYQDMGRAEVALKYYQEALKSNQYFFGTEENLQTGQITLDNFKEALNWEKKNYTILSNLLGEKDFRTSESNIWLKQFTRKAVQVQIEAKKAQRDITSNLSQEKFEKLTQQAGAARASAGGRGKKPASASLPSAAQAKPAFKI